MVLIYVNQSMDGSMHSLEHGMRDLDEILVESALVALRTEHQETEDYLQISLQHLQKLAQM